MATPTSPSSGQPPSFRTNINRAKTKRWVEAKSYSYDGDDWGDDDDYDDPPAPQSQGPPPRSTNFEGAYPSPAGGARYGDIPFQPSGPPGMRGASNPSPSRDRGRPSFDRPNDDRRTYSMKSASAFSEGPYPSAHRPPFADGDFGPPLMPRGADLRPRTGSPLRINTGQRRPSMDHDPYPHAPFIPDAQYGRGGPHTAPPFRPDSRGGSFPDLRGGPFPESRGGPYPQPRPAPYGDSRGSPYGANMPPPGSRSQSGGRPGPPDGRRQSPNYAMPGGFPPPMGGSSRGSVEGSRDSSPSKRFPPRKSSLSQEQTPFDPNMLNNNNMSGAEKSGNGTPPAKALPFIRPADIYKRMEEEREKQRRQSEESSRPSIDISGTQPRVPSQLGQKRSADSLGSDAAKRAGLEGDEESDNSRRLKPTLDPVTERKSEYGFDKVLEKTGPNHPSINTEIQQRKDKSEPPSASSTYSNRRDPISASTTHTQKSLGPLPDVGRVSAFGEDFLGNSSTPEPPLPTPNNTGNLAVRHQASGGFNTAINQAFDDSQNRVPQTPSSSVGDSIVRSDSANTSDISPIISRHSSNGNATGRSGPIPVESTIHEEPVDSTPRPESTSTMKAMSPLGRDDTDHEQLPALPRSGFRRNTDSPSPSNSPARRPLSVATGDIPKSELGSLVTATPTELESENQLTTSSQGGRSEESWAAPPEVQKQSSESSDARDYAPPIPRAESPSKGALKGLKDTFESSPERQSLTASFERSPETPRPSNTRLESFRPSIPGGWNSYTTNTGRSTPTQEKQNQYPKEPTLADLRLQEAEDDRYKEETPTPEKASVKDEGPSTKAFAAAATAGTALASALAAAAGMSESRASDRDDESVLSTPRAIEKMRDLAPFQQTSAMTSPKRDTISAASSAPPTPPPKDTPSIEETEARQVSGGSNYFPSPLRTGASRETSPETPKRPRISQNWSTDTSPQDTENDRLRKEIVKSLTPRSSNVEAEARPDADITRSEPSSNLAVPPPARDQVESTLLPKEYDSYWNETNANDYNEGSSEPRTTEEEHTMADQAAPVLETPPADMQHSETRPALKKRFSWESWSDEEPEQDVPQETVISAPPGEDTRQTSETTQERGPSLTQEEVHARVENTRLPAQEEIQTPTGDDYSQEVLNQENSRLSATTEDHTNPSVTSPPASEPRFSSDVQPLPQETLAAPFGFAKSEPTILSFREILALKAPSDRIQAYNTARDQFATMDTGLGDWLQHTGEQVPEHASMVANNGRFSAREAQAILGHKVSPPRSKFPRLASLGAVTQPQGTEDKPTPDSAFAGKVSSQQLLLSAGKIGGKAGGAAKGLFAKGKNKFRNSGGGEKAFFHNRRKSQPVVIVTDETPHSNKSAIPTTNPPSDPPQPKEEVRRSSDNADTWSLSYAPTVASRNRSSSEKPPPIPKTNPQSFGSLAPPPYKFDDNVEKAQTSAAEDGLVSPTHQGHSRDHSRAASPHISALGSTDGNEPPSRSISEVTRPTASGDELSPTRPTFGAEREFPSLSPMPESAENLHTVENVDPEKATPEGPTEAPQPPHLSEPPQQNSEGHEDGLSLAEPAKVQGVAPIEDLKPEPAVEEESYDHQQVDPATRSLDGESQLEHQPHGSTSPVPSPVPAVTEPTSIEQGQPANNEAESASAGYFSEREQESDPTNPIVSPSPRSAPRSAENPPPRPFSFVGRSDEEMLNRAPPDEATTSNALEKSMTGVTGGEAEDDQPTDRIQKGQSFSRPFAQPDIQDHPAFRESPDRDRRSQIYATEDPNSVPISDAYENRYGTDYSTRYGPTEEEQQDFRIPGPYGQVFKPRQPSYPQDRYPSGGYDHPAPGPQPHYKQPSPERPFIPRPQATEFSLPGMEAPAPHEPEADDRRRRRSSLFQGKNRSRSRPRIPLDDESDELHDVTTPEVPKKSPKFLPGRSRPVSENSQSQLGSTRGNAGESRDRLGQLMSPSPIPGQGGKDGKKKANKLQRPASASPDDQPKKKGFSRLSGLFGRSSSKSKSPAVAEPSTPTSTLKKPDTKVKPANDRQPSLHGSDEYRGQEFRGKPPPVGGYWGPGNRTPTTAGTNDSPSYGPRNGSPPAHNPDFDRFRTGSNGSYPPTTNGPYKQASNGPYPPTSNGQYPPTSQGPNPPVRSSRSPIPTAIPQDRSPPVNLRIDTSGGKRSSSDNRDPQLGPDNQSRQFYSQSARPAATGTSPYETTQPKSHSPYGYGSAMGLRQDSLRHAIDLHKRSRSPRAGRRNSDEGREEPNDPAYNLGTFRDGNRITSPQDRQGRNWDREQEEPWKIGLPEEEIRKRSQYYDHGQNHNGYLDDRRGRTMQPEMRDSGFEDSHQAQYHNGMHNGDYQQHAYENDEEDMYGDDDGAYGPPSRHQDHNGSYGPPNNYGEGHNTYPDQSYESRQRSPLPQHAPPTSKPNQRPFPTDDHYNAGSPNNYHVVPMTAKQYQQQQRGQVQQRPQQAQRVVSELPGSRAPNHPESESDEEEVVMSPTSYPGQEWMPKMDFGTRGWDE